jgi:hypothetical protein
MNFSGTRGFIEAAALRHVRLGEVQPASEDQDWILPLILLTTFRRSASLNAFFGLSSGFRRFGFAVTRGCPAASAGD